MVLIALAVAHVGVFVGQVAGVGIATTLLRNNPEAGEVARVVERRTVAVTSGNGPEARSVVTSGIAAHSTVCGRAAPPRRGGQGLADGGVVVGIAIQASWYRSRQSQHKQGI